MSIPGLPTDHRRVVRPKDTGVTINGPRIHIYARGREPASHLTDSRLSLQSGRLGRFQGLGERLHRPGWGRALTTVFQPRFLYESGVRRSGAKACGAQKRPIDRQAPTVPCRRPAYLAHVHDERRLVALCPLLCTLGFGLRRLLPHCASCFLAALASGITDPVSGSGETAEE